MQKFKQTNPLLVKDVIGQARSATHDLPEGGFVYGRQNRYDKYNASKLISDWDEYRCNEVKINE